MRRFLLLSFLLCPSTALATTLNVTSPGVTEGKAVLEYRTGIDFADEENRQNVSEYLHVDYGLTDLVALRLAGSGRKRGNSDLEYTATELQARLQFFKKADAGFDGAFRLSYQLADGDDKPDKAALAWLAAHPVDVFTFTYNVILSHDAGEDADGGIAADLRWQFAAPLPDTSLTLGLEGFHNLGTLGNMEAYNDQQHRIGVMLKGKLTDCIGFQTGYLQSISKAAPDQAIKFFLSCEF